ncbi:MAG: flavin reductase family protein [Rhodospirillales bacterium]|nr:MAG: flavin reductase family protein [Rhodospirillales bacterium]
MFYETKDHHGLPHDPFKSCVMPRPIGWLTTVSAAGVVNLAPFSFFNGVASGPPVVVVGINGRQPHGPKDTLANCRATGEFVANMATWDLRDAMNLTSASLPAEIDEMALVGLTPAPSKLVKPPRVKESPINLECRVLQLVDLPCDDPESKNITVFGHVVGIHIDDSVLTSGLVDVAKIRPIARLGYMDYTVIDEVFEMRRPSVEQALAARKSAAE